MQEDYLFIKKYFELNQKAFKKHLNASNKIKNFEVKWSNTNLEMYPYDNAINYFGKYPAKIYKRTPSKFEGLYLNKFKDNKVFCSATFETQDVTVFYIKEGLNKATLYYNKDGKRHYLNYAHYLFIKDDLIEKVLYYQEIDNDDTTFYTDKYTYDDNKKIHFIIRDGWRNNGDVIFPTATYRFNHLLDDNVEIFYKVLKLNGDFFDEMIFPPKKR